MAENHTILNSNNQGIKEKKSTRTTRLVRTDSDVMQAGLVGGENETQS